MKKNVCVIIGFFDTFISASVKKAIGSLFFFLNV